LRAKLDRISVIEGTLHAADKENNELSKFKEEASAFIEDLKVLLYRINKKIHFNTVHKMNSKEVSFLITFLF